MPHPTPHPRRHPAARRALLLALLTVLPLVAATSVAGAQSGPADGADPAAPLVRAVSSGGFCLPHGCDRTFELYPDGSWVLKGSFGAPASEQRGTLAAERLAALNDLIANTDFAAQTDPVGSTDVETQRSEPAIGACRFNSDLPRYVTTFAVDGRLEAIHSWCAQNSRVEPSAAVWQLVAELIERVR